MASARSYEDMAAETLARATRTETKLTRLCEHMGLDPTPGKERFTLDQDHATLELAGLDVSFGQLLTFLNAEGISCIDLLVGGKCVAWIAVRR